MVLRPVMRESKPVIFEIGHSGEWFMRIYEDGFIDFNLTLQKELGNSGLNQLIADSLSDNINLQKCPKCGHYPGYVDPWVKPE